jgi:hypothetical protein
MAKEKMMQSWTLFLATPSVVFIALLITGLVWMWLHDRYGKSLSAIDFLKRFFDPRIVYWKILIGTPKRRERERRWRRDQHR